MRKNDSGRCSALRREAAVISRSVAAIKHFVKHPIRESVRSRLRGRGIPHPREPELFEVASIRRGKLGDPVVE